MSKIAALVVAVAVTLTACQLRVAPDATDPAIDRWLADHVVAFDENEPLGDRLFVFLPGTGGRPEDYELLLREVAAAGMPAIGLSYANDRAVNRDLCAVNGDPDCFEDVRLEILDGVDRTALVSVSPANSITNRLSALLDHLNWNRFLDGDTPRWDRIVISGHSQGGGHAAMIAREHEVARVVFFAGPGDWWSGGPAPWLLEPHATPIDRYYGFVHTEDTPVFLPIWDALGVPGTPTSVDGAAPVPDTSHRLVTSRAGPSPHGMIVTDWHTPVAGDAPVYAPVWRALCCS